jgi:hypothetical protein
MAQRSPSSQRKPNHPLPLWPMAHIHAEQGETLATENEEATAEAGKERDDEVGQLAGVLRAAKRARATRT